MHGLDNINPSLEASQKEPKSLSSPGLIERGNMDKQERINKQLAKARKVRIANLANKGKTTYLNLKWMQQKYCIERMSLDNIAELCNTDYETIWYALRKLKIPNRIMSSEYEIEKYNTKVLLGLARR